MMRRYTIWDEMQRIQDEMDSLFGQFFGHDAWGMGRPLLAGPATAPGAKELMPTSYRTPLADVWETDKEIKASIEIPGIDKQDIQIHATDGGLEVSVEKKDEHKEEDKKRGIYRFERSYQGFYRFISLPESADKDKIDASYRNGVLELRIPKREIEGKATKRIEVK